MSQPTRINVAMLGQGFMGRTHSNAYGQLPRFFPDLPAQPVKYRSAEVDQKRAEAFADQWGWEAGCTDWIDLVNNPIVDLVDIVTPNGWHGPMARAALDAGKPCACEKPLAESLNDAQTMADLADQKGIPTFVWFNYRRVPAIGLAYRLIQNGDLGEIRHVRACYLQDWADETIPLLWRFRKSVAGSGANGDLNAHTIDLARFLTGSEIIRIAGAISKTFIRERALAEGQAGGGITNGGEAAGVEMGQVDVDDAMLFLAYFENGAVGSFEAARQATGNQNRNTIEINGTRGSIKFDFERMNELQYYDARLPRAVQGWSTIMCTHAGSHPYLEAWWPDAHLIGYEHTFINMAADIMRVLAGEEPLLPLANFRDAYETQRVLEAVSLSAEKQSSVDLKDLAVE